MALEESKWDQPQAAPAVPEVVVVVVRVLVVVEPIEDIAVT